MATAIGLFERSEGAERAVDLLLSRGFVEDEIGVLAGDQVVQEYLKSKTVTPAQGDAGTGAAGGALLGGLGGLVAGIAALALPGIGQAIAAGALASALGLPLVGAGVGAVAGGVIGALVSIDVPEDEAHAYAEGVKRGGVLVTVQTSEGRLAAAREVLRDAGAVDIDALRDEWRRGGWQSFNEPPTTPPRTDPERLAHPTASERPLPDPLTDLEVDKGGT